MACRLRWRACPYSSRTRTCSRPGRWRHTCPARSRCGGRTGPPSCRGWSPPLWSCKGRRRAARRKQGKGGARTGGARSGSGRKGRGVGKGGRAESGKGREGRRVGHGGRGEEWVREEGAKGGSLREGRGEAQAQAPGPGQGCTARGSTALRTAETAGQGDPGQGRPGGAGQAIEGIIYVPCTYTYWLVCTCARTCV